MIETTLTTAVIGKLLVGCEEMLKMIKHLDQRIAALEQREAERETIIGEINKRIPVPGGFFAKEVTALRPKTRCGSGGALSPMHAFGERDSAGVRTCVVCGGVYRD